ncbi:hypothetical protein TNCV_155311 [Trichonephila clavipes]|uniref:RNase H type-1 domain-containing protein n=1 Tax=Trichonephila clavipes TaxID=2585209 RepID=A0A8X6WH40_TRICX|nr:hypothetical protein TNCV_155311 [Trichonephila clavipes]
MTSLNILDLVVRLSSRHSTYFEWVPSHIGLNGNEIADRLAKYATADALRGDACLTFDELSSIKRRELKALWRVPLGILRKNLVGVTNLIFLGIGRRLYRAFLVATSSLLLLNRAGKSFQSVIEARMIRPPLVIFLTRDHSRGVFCTPQQQENPPRILKRMRRTTSFSVAAHFRSLNLQA